MLIVLIMIVVAVWAAWVAYTVNQEGGYPPYQDSTKNTTVEPDAAWPFPKDRP